MTPMAYELATDMYYGLGIVTLWVIREYRFSESLKLVTCCSLEHFFLLSNSVMFEWNILLDLS